MAHKFSAAPPYGAQYAATPFYSPFASTAVQQMSNGIPGLQQPNVQQPNLQTPTNISNAVRYDANAQIHSQPAPLPFAAHFNPELLKHFPPPPPPPPGAHFGAVPSPVSGFPTFPQVANLSTHPTAQQSFPHLTQQSTPSNAVPIPIQSATPTNDPRLYNSAMSLHGAGGMTEHMRNQPSPAQGGRYDRITVSSGGRLFDGMENTVDSHSKEAQYVMKDIETRRDSGSGFNREQQQQFPPPTVIARGLHPARHDSGRSLHGQALSSAELKERAKAALLSLAPHNIRYNDFRAEGIDPQILQQLYEELGLSWQNASEINRSDLGIQNFSTPNETMTTTQSKPTSYEPPSASANAGCSLAKAAPTIVPPATTTILSTSSQNMERKDRIAQLLAAKAGKVISLGTTSKSQSPASAIELNQAQAHEPDITAPAPNIEPVQLSRKASQADLVRQRMEQLKKETKPMARSEHIQTSLTTQARSSQQHATDPLNPQDYSTAALPTPIREHLAQNGFSSLIPGLFLTAAELEVDAAPAPLPASQTAHTEESFVSATTVQPDQFLDSTQTSIIESARRSRKRSIEGNVDSITESYHSPKRQALQADGSLDVSMEVDEGAADDDDDASEGEIVEEEPVLQDVQVSIIDPVVSRSLPESDQQNHVTKQTEIDVLRKRIPGMGQRQSLKRGQSSVLSPTGSNTSIPTANPALVSLLSSPVSKVIEHTLPSAKPDERFGQSPRSLVKATPEQIAERAAQLKADFLRSRALRQKQLQEGIPALDDEVAKTRHKLKQAKDKLGQVHTEIQQQHDALNRTLENQKKLVQEIETLEKQLSDGVSGQKQYSNELNNLKQDGNKGPSVKASSFSSASDNRSLNLSNQDPTSKDGSPKVLETGQTRVMPDAARTSSGADGTSTSERGGEQSQVFEQHSISGSAVDLEENGNVDSNNGADVEGSSIESSRIQSPLATAPVLPLDEIGDENVEHMQDSDEAMEESEEDSEDSRMSIDEETNDSVSMSDSGSDDYEPAEPEESPRTDDKLESDDYEPVIEDSNHFNGTTEEEGDDYEPAETLSPVDTNALSSSPKSAHTTSSPTDANSEANDGNSAGHEKALAVSEVPITVNELAIDDQEKGLQLSEADTLTKPQSLLFDENIEGSNVLGANDTAPVRYVPYKSPLTSLKSYRFHPSFNESVRDGYRSLTYSHKIDPKSPICLTELGGNLCTDPDCQDQHFGSMALTDDKILVQMSSASDIKDKKLRDQFLTGLKQVIARLRQEGCKDFTAVADALSHYRREWKAAQAGS